MPKYIALSLSFLVLFFSACTSSVPLPSPNEKAFEEEDQMAIFALYAKSRGDANSTISLFEVLYEKSDKLEYRNEEIITMLQAGQFERALERIDFYRSELDEDDIDIELQRYEIAALMELKRYDEAKEVALDLLEFSKTEQEYQQVAAIYMIEGRYEFALRYLQSAYAIDYDEQILDKMAIILYVNLNRKAEALSFLETHMRLHGCSETICLRLGSFYSEENNVEGMLRIYTRLYENTKEEKYAQTVIKLYNYKKDTIGLIQFLEKSGSDDALLLQMYINTRNYAKVVSLGDKLYEEDGDPYYLGQSAIFEYEGAKDKRDPKMVESVMLKLEDVVSHSDDALYLNYLGYLLIDHEIDVPEGMRYVRKALEVEADSVYYLDSLAWGYYKQGNCTKALSIIRKVQKGMDKEDPEVSAHVKAIQQCIKNKGKKQAK